MCSCEASLPLGLAPNEKTDEVGADPQTDELFSARLVLSKSI